MNQALLLNLGILIVIGVCLVQLNNPLALFGLLLLKELPYGLMLQGSGEEEVEEGGNPIGFIQ